MSDALAVRGGGACRRRLGGLLPLCALALAAACGGATRPDGAEGLTLRFVEGAGTSDTIGSVVRVAVELVDGGGAPVTDRRVAFQVDPVVHPTGYQIVPALLRASGPEFQGNYAEARTDVQGRVTAFVRFELLPTPLTLRAWPIDSDARASASFTIRPGRPAAVQINPTIRNITVVAQTVSPTRITAHVRDRAGNPLADTARFLAGPHVATVSADGAVTAGTVGRGYVVAEAGGLRDSVGVSVVPPATVTHVHQDQSTFSLRQVGLAGAEPAALTSLSRGTGMLAPDPSSGRVLLEGGRLYDPGTRTVRLLPTPSGAGEIRGNGGAFAPDGAWVYLTAQRSGGSVYTDVWRMRPDGTQPERLLFADSVWHGALAVSPDGGTLVAVAARHGGPTSTVRVDLATGARSELLPYGAVYPRFSPDGQYVVYLTAAGRLARLPAQGGVEEVITPSRTFELTDFDLTPDGAHAVLDGRSARNLLGWSVWGWSLVSLATGEEIPLGLGQGSVIVR